MLRQQNSFVLQRAELLLSGDAILPVALAFAVLDITDSPSALDLVLAADFPPGVVFLPIGGVLDDRMQRQRLMIVCKCRALLLSSARMAREMPSVAAADVRG